MAAGILQDCTTDVYIIRGLANLPERFRGAAITIGNFDGVHLGHQALFAALRRLAQARNLPTMAVTFEPHPGHLLRKDNPLPRITGVRGKVRWMEAAGLDAILFLQFTRQLAATEPEDFVRRYLVEGLAARLVLAGYDCRFGAKGRGDGRLLAQQGEKYHFEVHQQSALDLTGETVSSTRIRQAIWEADFATAERLLGRPFELEGRIGGGSKRGRLLGFPTANMALGDRLHPPAGVYVVAGQVGDRWLPGVANLGRNPTFGGADVHLEVHFLADCGDLYRQVVRIRFLRHLRAETAFPDGEALVAQIRRDVQQAQTWLAEHPLPDN